MTIRENVDYIRNFAYSAELTAVNLARLIQMRDEFSLAWAYSDVDMAIINEYISAINIFISSFEERMKAKQSHSGGAQAAAGGRSGWEYIAIAIIAGLIYGLNGGVK